MREFLRGLLYFVALVVLMPVIMARWAVFQDE